MKILDIRKTQQGWVADVMYSPRSILPMSVSLAEISASELEEYANTDPEHINYSWKAEAIAEEADWKSWKETQEDARF
jgi:hypothetical protein